MRLKKRKMKKSKPYTSCFGELLDKHYQETFFKSMLDHLFKKDLPEGTECQNGTCSAKFGVSYACKDCMGQQITPIPFPEIFDD